MSASITSHIVTLWKEKMKNLKHWEALAKRFGTQVFATTKCKTIKQLEIYALSKHLKDGVSVLEVGAGNGLNIIALAQQFPNSQFVGMDFSKEMVRQAYENAKGLSNVIFVKKMLMPSTTPL